MEDGARGLVGDGAGVGVNAHHVAVGDRVRGLGALQDGESHVDRVAVEDAREALGNDARDARGLDGHRRVLARRTAAKVLVGHDDVARLHARDEGLVEVLEAVLGKLGGVRRVEVTSRNNDVGVYVSAVAKDGSSELHGFPFCKEGWWVFPPRSDILAQRARCETRWAERPTTARYRNKTQARGTVFRVRALTEPPPLKNK